MGSTTELQQTPPAPILAPVNRAPISTPPSRTLCVSLHDVAPATWSACAPILAMLDQTANIPLSLLVVPDYHRRGRIDRDVGFLRAMERRLARGDEIVLHGFYHLDDGPVGALDYLRRRVYTAGEAEFSALDQAQACERLEAGLSLFQRLGWPVSGFVAPVWLLNPAVMRALQALPFHYTSTLRGFYRLPSGQFLPSQSLVYSVRTRWRRWLSRRWNPYLFARMQQQPLLRFALHPADAVHADVMDDWRRMLLQALDSRQAMTKTNAIQSS